jgi:SH3-like domain-containing protein
MSKTLFTLSVLLILFFPFAGISFSKTLSVKSEKLYLRSGPGRNYKAEWEYDKGFPLKVLSIKKHWIKVEDFENDTGWVPSKKLQNKPAVVVKANKKNKESINIRTGPGLKFKVIGKAFYGVVFEKLGEKKGWTKVRHDSGLIGWIKSTFLWGTS